MKKFPNASVLIIITQANGVGKGQNILFIYSKPVPDLYTDDKIHWYKGAGKDGKANSVWEKLSIKQWAACGKDSNIHRLFDEIISTGKLSIDTKEIVLTIPTFKLIDNDHSSFRGRDTKFENLTTENNILIPQEFYQKNNLKFISGYKIGSMEVKPIFPFGFFEDDFIYNNLAKNVWGIKEYRAAYLTFHGVRETSEKGLGSRELVGFYQQNFESASDYYAIVKNEGKQIIGKSLIDQKTGYFKINLSEPNQRGELEISIGDKKEEAIIEYALLQDINIETQIANGVFNDVYGRSHMITSKSKIRPTNIHHFTWQRDVYSDTTEADKKLSDLFKSILDYLGPKILIADPHFIGNLKSETITQAISISPSQQSFINAFIHSTVEKGIEEMNILGCWHRAKNHIKKDDGIELDKIEQLFSVYKMMFKNLIERNKLEKYFQASSIKFINSNEEFHNRYWFSLTEENNVQILDKGVIITNSFGNMKELDIIPISDAGQLRQIIMKYTRLFKNADLKLRVDARA